MWLRCLFGANVLWLLYWKGVYWLLGSEFKETVGIGERHKRREDYILYLDLAHYSQCWIGLSVLILLKEIVRWQTLLSLRYECRFFPAASCWVIRLQLSLKFFEENERTNLTILEWCCRYTPCPSDSTAIYIMKIQYFNRAFPMLSPALSTKAFRASLQIYSSRLLYPKTSSSLHLSKPRVKILASSTHRLHTWKLNGRFC